MKTNKTYIILAAGKGMSLYPLTSNCPKTSYKLDENITVLQRMVKKIKDYDKYAEIVLVLGYMYKKIKYEFNDYNIKIVINPFYESTGSISSLWFAKSYLERENVTIINGDVVYEDKLVENIITEFTLYPYVLFDSSIINDNNYNVCVKNNNVLVMSKKLEYFTGKYACCVKLDAVSSRLLKAKIEEMIDDNMCGQYFEDVLVQMIMFDSFELYYKDIKDYNWVEINNVDNLIKAKQIHQIREV